jgi:hypothetical protein
MVIMDWKFGVRVSAILVICGIVAIVMYKQWCLRKSQVSSSYHEVTEDTLDRALDGSSGNDTRVTSCAQDLCSSDYEVDSSVPEYVEEMNDYRGEEEQMLGASIADVYDNLTRAPDISQGKELEMHTDSGIAALDPWEDNNYMHL